MLGLALSQSQPNIARALRRGTLTAQLWLQHLPTAWDLHPAWKERGKAKFKPLWEAEVQYRDEKGSY